MTHFITRVELYGNATEQTYEMLHQKMQANGFSRSFNDNGKSLKMPSAMYFSSHVLTTIQVRDLATQIAASVWKDSAVLVTKTESRIEYSNLRTPVLNSLRTNS